MDNQTFTPEESLSLISRTIQQAKSRYRENGVIYILTGLCLSVASMAQHFLLMNHYYSINFYPYFIMPFFGMYIFFHFQRQNKKQHFEGNIQGRILAGLGIILGLNFLILGLFEYMKLQAVLFPLFFILLAIYLLVLGISLRYWLFILSALVLNLLAYYTFTVPRLYHPLVFSIATLLTFVLPGILLRLKIANEDV